MTIYYTKQIDDAMTAIAKKVVSKNVFQGSRPSSTSPSMDVFVVVSTPLTQYDKLMYQTMTGRFEIYVKNKATGVPNRNKLDDYLNAIVAELPYVSSDKRISITEPALYLKGDDGLGYSVYLINTTVTVNTTDRSKK